MEDISKELRRLEKIHKKKDFCRNDLAELLKCLQFNTEWEKRKKEYEEKLSKGDLPVCQIIEEYYRRTGDSSFNLKDISNPKHQRVAYYNAALDWESGLIAKGRKEFGYFQGLKECPHYIKLSNNWFQCEKNLYTLKIKDLKPVYTIIKRR